MKQQVYAWLKAGIMEGYASSPKEYSLVSDNKMGTRLANVALHGLEENLKEFCANKIDVYVPCQL